MNKLTMRDEYNNADVIGVDSEKLQDGLTFKEFNCITKALNRLADSEGMSCINSNENLMKITEQEYRDIKNKVCRECWKEIKQDQYGNFMGLEDEKDYWICDECIDEEIVI